MPASRCRTGAHDSTICWRLAQASRSLSAGAPADVTIVDPDRRTTVRAAQLRSKSKNTPFDGWDLRGGVAATIVGGSVVYDARP